MAEYECYALVTAQVTVEAEDEEEAAEKAANADTNDYDVAQVEEVLPEDCTQVD